MYVANTTDGAIASAIECFQCVYGYFKKPKNHGILLKFIKLSKLGERNLLAHPAKHERKYKFANVTPIPNDHDMLRFKKNMLHGSISH